MDTGSEFDYGTGIDPTQLYGQGYASWGNGSSSGSASQGESNDTGGSNDRFPDYYNLNISIGMPALGNVIGWNMSVSLDRYGQAHISPFGIAIGKSLSQVSYSFTGNWLMQNQTPTEQQLSNFLTGNGFNFGGGAGYGGSASYTPGSGWAMGTGYYTPQIGASYNYTPSWPFLNPSTNIKW